MERAGRESVQAAVEVTAVLALPTGHGNVGYVFGARVDAEQSGRIVLMRLDAFRASTLADERSVRGQLIHEQTPGRGDPRTA